MRKALSFVLTFLLSLPSFALPSKSSAQSLKEIRGKQKSQPRLAPDLEEILAQDDEQGPTLGQLRQNRLAAKGHNQKKKEMESEDLNRVNGITLPSMLTPAGEKQSFIVQLNGSTPDVVLQEKLALLGGKIKQKHSGSGLMTIEAPRSAIRQIAADNNISYVSPDRMVVSSGHVGETVGWYNTGISDAGDADPNTWLSGGVGHTVIIDSGIFSNHSLLKWGGAGGTQKVMYSQDFTGQAITGDPFGHGTHVASLLAGDWVLGSSAYEGIGSGAPLINLRVLNSNGQGTASAVIAALDWCVTNKTKWNIRVINLSLGSNAKDSYVNDPMCQAARRAWNAGIVVVAAAGNDGKASNGNKIYGGIHSPGIEPSIITVGAANTFGTNVRSDDKVATYSSRGPTRGYVTLANGTRKYDNLIKPDLIAPGNKLIGARATHNGVEGKLATDNPSLKTGSATAAESKLIYLSGTSMSAPVVAAAAMLLVQTNPNLTPNLIKAILMYTAQPISGFNMLEQGAGMLNVDGAIRVARLVKTTMPTTNGTSLLTTSLPTSQASTIAGQSCRWSQGVITNHGFLFGSNLMNFWQNVYSSGQVLGDSTTYANGTLSLVSGKTFSITLKSGAVSINSSGLILGDAANPIFTSGQVLGDGQVIGDGTLLGDGQVIGDGTILADGTTRADMTLGSTSAYLGDNTTGMSPAP